MSTKVQVTRVPDPVRDVAAPAAPVVRAPSEALRGHDTERERELDLMAARIEDTAAGVGVALLLALFGIAFVIATLTGFWA